MIEDNKHLVRRLYDDYFNPGLLDRLGDIVSPDFQGVGDQRGPDAFAAPIRLLRAAFPDIHYTIEDLIAEGDRVAVRWTWHGTFQHPFRTYTPTGHKMANSGFAIFQIEHGKIARTWLETDRLGFLVAAGVIPYNPAFGPPPPR